MSDAMPATLAAPVCTPDARGHCSVCADEGRLARVLALDEAARTALVAVDGTEQTVALDLTAGVRVGDLILVHLGFAIAQLESA